MSHILYPKVKQRFILIGSCCWYSSGMWNLWLLSGYSQCLSLPLSSFILVLFDQAHIWCSRVRRISWHWTWEEQTLSGILEMEWQSSSEKVFWFLSVGCWHGYCIGVWLWYNETDKDISTWQRQALTGLLWNSRLSIGQIVLPNECLLPIFTHKLITMRVEC